MAKKKTAAPATGTGTGTETKTDTKTKVKVEVTVNTELLTLVKRHDEATEKAATFLVDMCEFIAKENLSNAVVIKTLMEARGIKEASAASQCSRMRRLLNDKESFQALKDGNATVRASVKNAQSRRAPTKQSIARALDQAVTRLVNAAKASGQDKKTLLVTIESAFDKEGIK